MADTQVGYYISNSNKHYSIYTSDLTVDGLQKKQTLPIDSLIISSPINSYNFDKGTPAILMTDSMGKALPLTYSFNNMYFTHNAQTNTIDLSYTYVSKFEKFEQMYNKLETLFSSVAVIDKDYYDDNSIYNTFIVSYINDEGHLTLEEWGNQVVYINSNNSTTALNISVDAPNINTANSYNWICLGYYINPDNITLPEYTYFKEFITNNTAYYNNVICFGPSVSDSDSTDIPLWNTDISNDVTIYNSKQYLTLNYNKFINNNATVGGYFYLYINNTYFNTLTASENNTYTVDITFQIDKGNGFVASNVVDLPIGVTIRNS